MRLREIEEILQQTRVLMPVPSRPSLIALIETGTLDGKKIARVWMVYEDSFRKWVKSFQPDDWKLIKPTVRSNNGDGDR